MDKPQSSTKLRKELRNIFKRHEYHNLYGNKHGFRYEDVMSDIEELINKYLDLIDCLNAMVKSYKRDLKDMNEDMSDLNKHLMNIEKMHFKIG